MIERNNSGRQKKKNAASCVSTGQLETKGGIERKVKLNKKTNI
jgi:hypothetical protein